MLIGKHGFVIFLRLFVIRNFRGTCSSIEMLLGYVARESLGSPAQYYMLHICLQLRVKFLADNKTVM